MYGGGAWPHYSAYQRNELASNGNYYEPDAIAVRHGICGDPEQVGSACMYVALRNAAVLQSALHTYNNTV